MSKIAKKENPIYDKTESCIRLIFSSAPLLAIQLPGEPPQSAYGGKLIYQIDLDSLCRVDEISVYAWDVDDEDAMSDTLMDKVNSLVTLFGAPLELETDYPGFKNYGSDKTLAQWVKAVWLAHTIVRDHGKEEYKSFLQVLGANY